jgi:hypothetical protein
MKDRKERQGAGRKAQSVLSVFSFFDTIEKERIL